MTEYDDLCEACGKHPAKQAGLCGRCLKKLPELDGIADRFREAAESNLQRYLVNIGMPAALRRRVSVSAGSEILSRGPISDRSDRNGAQ